MATTDQALGTIRAPAIRWFSGAGVVVRRVLANPAGGIALLVVLLFIAAATLAPWIAPYSPIAISPRIRLQGPSIIHWLGTDQLGRDVLSRLIYGTATALRVASLGTGGALLVGLGLGLAAGIGPKALDSFLLLICDAAKSLPMILFALALVAIYGPSLATLIAVMIFTMAPAYFRVVRNQVLVLRGADFVLAARAMGSSGFRVALTHLLPNLIGPLLVLIAMDVPAVIGIESGLSFLGQGVQPPDPSWGTMLSDGYSFIRQSPHLVISAGAPIIVITIAFTFLGETLRDAFDPKHSRRRE